MILTKTKDTKEQIIAGHIQLWTLFKSLYQEPKRSVTVNIMPDEFYQELQADYRKKFV